jgi:hypothetical protein
LAEHTSGCVQDQIAICAHLLVVSALETEPDCSRIGARVDHEVILELLLIKVEHQIHARIDAIFHTLVGRNCCDLFVEISAFGMIDRARHLLITLQLGRKACAHKPQSQNDRLMLW